MAEGVLERVVQHGRAHVQEGLHGRPAPAHLLLLGHALGYDLVDRALHERRRDRLTTPTPGGVGHQRAPIALEVAQKLADVSLEATDAGHLAYRLASRPAAQGSELAPAPPPAPVPPAPPRHRPGRKRHIARSRPRTASSARWVSAVPAPRPRAACSACSKRTAACHQSSTIMAPGSTSRCSRHSPASPSHSTVAGVSAPTPALASACLNASDAAAGPLRAKAKRCWAPWASITLPATTSKWRSSCRWRLRM